MSALEDLGDKLSAQELAAYTVVVRQLDVSSRKLKRLLNKVLNAVAAATAGGVIVTLLWLQERPEWQAFITEVSNSSQSNGLLIATVATSLAAAGALQAQANAAALLATAPTEAASGTTGAAADLITGIQVDPALTQTATRLEAEKFVARVQSNVLAGRPQEARNSVDHHQSKLASYAAAKLTTEQMEAVRDTLHATYEANNCSSWRWDTSLDERVCTSVVILGQRYPGCKQRHGKIFPEDVRMDTHYNCRCVPMPSLLAPTATPDLYVWPR